MTTPILEVEHLTKAFGNAVALDGLTFSVQPGEIHAILGENGAGKTTLMKILAGVYPHTAYTGQLRVAGEPVAFNSTRDALGHGIAAVMRRPGIFARLSVAENVSVGQWHTQHSFLVRESEIARVAQASLEMIGLKVNPGMPAGQLTPGQQRLLAIARAIASAPKLIVLDEPTTGLTTAAELSALLRTVRTLIERGITCLYLTRRPMEVLQLADRVTVLRDGSANGEWLRTEFDDVGLTRAMMSQRPGDAAYVDHDDQVEPGGLLGSLRSMFSFGRREG